MKYSKKWEDIDDNSDRLMVPRGWIVRSAYSACASGASIHMIFIEDRNHDWELE